MIFDGVRNIITSKEIQNQICSHQIERILNAPDPALALQEFIMEMHPGRALIYSGIALPVNDMNAPEKVLWVGTKSDRGAYAGRQAG